MRFNSSDDSKSSDGLNILPKKIDFKINKIMLKIAVLNTDNNIKDLK